MAINKIIKLDLEERAVFLHGKKDMSYGDIATTLTDESGQKISKASVQRFFATRDRDKQKAVAMSAKLHAKVVDAEINTIEEAMATVEKLKEICQKLIDAGDLRGAILAAREIYSGLDLINKTLGKYQASPKVQFNFQEVNVTESRERIARRINSIATRVTANEDTE